jgi:hypothetical protein
MRQSIFRADSRKARQAHQAAKIALLRILQVRFRAFERKFGRLPKPDEPVFFEESCENPVKADIAKARAQLAEGAREAGVELDPVLRFLGLSAGPAKVVRQSSQPARRIQRPHPRRS